MTRRFGWIPFDCFEKGSMIGGNWRYELVAELGVDGDETPVESFGPSFAEELEELAQEIEQSSDEKA